MKRVAVLCVLVLMPLAGSAEAQEKPFAQVLDELLPGIGAANIADRQGPQQQFQDICLALGAPGKEAHRAEACKVMADKLGPETPKPARIWLLKQLEFIGRAECVEAVGKLLDEKDAELFDWARRALEHNPAREANAPLLAKLQAADSAKRRVALLNSLGARADQASTAAVAGFLADQDAAVVAAAANALGKIASPEAAAALEAARAKVPAALQPALADAHLRCADRLLAQGKAEQAAAVYAKLAAPDQPRPIRLAALAGQLHASGDHAAPLVMKLLASEDADARAIAAGQIAAAATAVGIRTFAAEFAKLPPAGQVLLLGGLVARGDKAALPIALAAAQSTNLEVKLAGYQALGRLGDASVVPLLLEAVFAGTEASGPARESLQTLSSPGTDEAILAAMQGKDGTQRGTLIEILQARRTASAAPVLLQQAQDADAGVRGRAIRALGNVAEPKYLPDMIALLLRTEKGPQRDDVEKAIMLIANRINEEDRRAESILAALRGASDADRCVLLPVLGRIGGKPALEPILAAIASSNRDVKDAGVRGLCNWPDAGVADELSRLAQNAPEESHRLWALRALIRVIGLDLSRPPKETLALFQKAMQLAWRDEERRLILSRVGVARCAETMRWVVPYLENDALAKDASQAVIELAHRRELMGPNQAEFTAALKKVIEVCKDQELVARAKRIIEGQ